MKLISSVKMLMVLAFAATATAVAVPASAATPSASNPYNQLTQSAATLLTPAATVARQNPAGCSTRTGTPHKTHGKVEATGTQKCARTVSGMAIKVCLYRNGRQVACSTAIKTRNTRSISATVSKRCRNNSRGSFFSRAQADYLYRGHIYVSNVVQSRSVSLACGF
jgi:hypothetical protein